MKPPINKISRISKLASEYDSYLFIQPPPNTQLRSGCRLTPKVGLKGAHPSHPLRVWLSLRGWPRAFHGLAFSRVVVGLKAGLLSPVPVGSASQIVVYGLV